METDALLDLWQRSVRATHDFLTEADIDAMVPEAREALSSPGVWVAEVDGAAAGFMQIDGNKVEALFIDPDRRGSGLGTALLDHARQLCRDQAELRLDVNEQNPAALGFYLSRGFTLAGRSPVDGAGRPFPHLHLVLRHPGIAYKTLNRHELDHDLFSTFNRHQEVKRCWRKENGHWTLKDISFVEEWGAAEKRQLVDCLIGTVESGGAVFAAFDGDRLVGFASLERVPLGTGARYLQLSSIHTSVEYRGRGIGRRLFSLACAKAREFGADKLYISAHSSEESQRFYHTLGCVDALELNHRLVEKEPFDRHLEYVLQLPAHR